MTQAWGHILPELDALLEQLPPPALDLEENIRALLVKLTALHGCVEASLSLDDPALDAPLRVRVTSARAAVGRIQVARQSLTYGAETIGRLDIALYQDGHQLIELQAALTHLARPLARYVRRHAVEAWSRARFGQPMALVGASGTMLAFEALLERASLSDLPVLLAGEFGTEKLVCALSIHCLGARRRGPFVEVNCSEPEGDPSAWFRAAEDGTLFLNGIEKLSQAHQERVPLFMRSHLGQWLKGPGSGDVRVIAAAGADLDACASQGRFSRALLAEVQILSLVVPALRQRPSDIAMLTACALRRRGFDPARKTTPAMDALFQAYDWPENLVELERVTTRLAVMTEDRPIGRADIELHAPWLIETPLRDTRPILFGAPEGKPVEKPGEKTTEARAPADWAEVLIANDPGPLGRLHPSLRRALKHLSLHCAEQLSLADLAELGHVSASHLGYLFRTELGTSFKQLQAQLRIGSARRLLTDRSRMQITEIAMAVGFSDLSHFERAFRRQLGESPSAYRQSHAHPPVQTYVMA